MPLMPKRVKFRKRQRSRIRGMATVGNRIVFGEYGLRALDRAWVSNIQIEACRVAINRAMKRKGKMWIRVFPDMPKTKKPLETRMGKGKGPVDHWAASVKPGSMLFEVDGVTEAVAREALKLAAAKLSIATRFVQRHHRA